MKIPKSKLASIIIVNFNNANLLNESLKSALNQSYKFKEVIVVDDRSVDNSMEVLKKFKNRIKIVRNKKKTKHGSYNQINSYHKGYLKSKGNYLFFLDSDDLFKKNKVEEIIKQFRKKSNLKIIFDLPILKYSKKIKKEKFNQKTLFFSNWPRFTPQSCISLKKCYAEEIFSILNIRKFDTLWFDFRIATYTYLKYKKLYILNKYLTYYRQLDNSASKEYKFLSKKWWFRRNQAHHFVDNMSNKLYVKKRNTLDKIFTFFINKILNNYNKLSYH